MACLQEQHDAVPDEPQDIGVAAAGTMGMPRNPEVISSKRSLHIGLLLEEC